MAWIMYGPNQHPVTPMTATQRAAPALPSIDLEIMTFNLRYANEGDGMNSWRFRRAHVFEIINRFKPVIMGIQEGLKEQLIDLHANLQGNYQRFGVPREEDGGKLFVPFNLKI